MDKLEYKTNEIIGKLITMEKYTFVDKNMVADVVRQTVHEFDMRELLKP